MLGQVPPSGTGNVQLLFDERKMYLQTKDIDTIVEETPEVDAAEIEEKIKQASAIEIKCLDPKNYEFDFVPMGKSSLQKDKQVVFSKES
jgi:hypothetical protein